jgi:hypothetical protein
MTANAWRPQGRMLKIDPTLPTTSKVIVEIDASMRV